MARRRFISEGGIAQVKGVRNEREEDIGEKSDVKKPHRDCERTGGKVLKSG